MFTKKEAKKTAVTMSLFEIVNFVFIVFENLQQFKTKKFIFLFNIENNFWKKI